MQNLKEPPGGIIISISQGILKEKGVFNWIRNFINCMNKEDCLYYMCQGTRPKHDFLYFTS